MSDHLEKTSLWDIIRRKRNERIVAYYLLLFLAIGCSSAKIAGEGMTPSDKARAHLEQLIAASEFPGIQYMVLNKHGVVFEFNGGRREVADNAKVNADTTFLSSSATKVITALAVLQLVDRGLVSLDDPFTKYFKRHPYGNAVTVRRLNKGQRHLSPYLRDRQKTAQKSGGKR